MTRLPSRGFGCVLWAPEALDGLTAWWHCLLCACTAAQGSVIAPHQEASLDQPLLQGISHLSVAAVGIWPGAWGGLQGMCRHSRPSWGCRQWTRPWRRCAPTSWPMAATWPWWLWSRAPCTCAWRCGLPCACPAPPALSGQLPAGSLLPPLWLAVCPDWLPLSRRSMSNPALLAKPHSCMEPQTLTGQGCHAWACRAHAAPARRLRPP